MEAEFWQRARGYFARFGAAAAVRTQRDGEKQTYAELMAAAIVGDRQRALQLLQAEDAEAATAHAHTAGIDYYWNFTLKQQIRKFFLFGNWLNPTYRHRMWQGAKLWTATDPLPRFELIHALDSPDPVVRTYALNLLRQLTGQNFGQNRDRWWTWWQPWSDRPWQEQEEAERQLNPHPHPFYGRGRGGIGLNEQWGPEVRGSWVDGRNTPNLRAMRETSIYLMAEAAGNELTRRLYKDKLRYFVWSLYQIGMGEWDSENYLPHSITPFLNLHDFAQDREVRLLAKAALDWLLMSGALKYYRGGFGGPTLRDLGGASHVFGSSASHPLYLYFGDSPLADPNPRYDDLHTVTSSYRPPLALVGLAQKAFPRPVELLNTKPHFDTWKPGNEAAPVFFETLYFGRNFYLGSVVNQGEATGMPFKLLAKNRSRGVDYFLANAAPQFHRGMPGLQMAQNRQLLLWLRPNDGKPIYFQSPQTVHPKLQPNLWVFPLESTYIAVRPIQLKPPRPVSLPEPACRDRCSKYYQEQVWQAEVADATAPFVGFAMEVGEVDEYAGVTEFQQALEQGELDLSQLAQGKVVLRGIGGRSLAMTYNAIAPPLVIRDQSQRHWAREWQVYSTAAGLTGGPVQQDWQGGSLRVEAGGYRFEQTVSRSGQVRFSETHIKSFQITPTHSPHYGRNWSGKASILAGVRSYLSTAAQLHRYNKWHWAWCCIR